MHFYSLMLIIVCFCRDLQQNQAYEYCTDDDDDENRLCSQGAEHIVCNPDQVANLGDVIGVVPMTEKMKRNFLDLQNAFRNNTACGTLKNDNGIFSKATRMRQLIWDDELAYISQIHAQRCNMEHDKCRNTRRHPKSGQNLGAQSSSDKLPILTVAAVPVQLWYDEYKLVKDPPGMAKLYPAEQLSEVGHYTQLVNDRVSRVGCAITLCERANDKNFHYHTTCNYDYSNMQGAPTYDDNGNIGSKCDDWGTALSSEYNCLCDNSGEIFNKK